MKKLLEQIAELSEYVDFEMRAEFADRIDKLRKQIDSHSNEYVIDFDDVFPTLDKLNPAGYMHKDSGLFLKYEKKAIFRESWGNYTIPLYAHQPAPKRLSDEDILALDEAKNIFDWLTLEVDDCQANRLIKSFARAIEREVEGEYYKNTSCSYNAGIYMQFFIRASRCVAYRYIRIHNCWMRICQMAWKRR